VSILPQNITLKIKVTLIDFAVSRIKRCQRNFPDHGFECTQPEQRAKAS
jgi:hypothetical protein